MNLINEKELEIHVKVLGWLHILGNALFLAVGVTGFIFLTGIGVVSGDLEAVKVLGFIGSIGVVFFSILALPGMVAGYGLLKRRSWSRVLAMVVGFLGLINFPIGTIIGLYTFVVLLQSDAANYFTPLKPA